ncbi:MAG TPA: sensor histidine kinase [Candidatus Limnocylindrales bacterium]|nr:sensor histidine kinase [Candidatus Limnocylindrales bacterium]
MQQPSCCVDVSARDNAAAPGTPSACLGGEPAHRPWQRQSVTDQSPTVALLSGLLLTLLTVVAYSWYITIQISGLRSVQMDLAEKSRKDSLQLLRIHNDLNALALAMRDMLDGDEPYPLTAWRAQFLRVREDLNDALRVEDRLAVVHRPPELRHYLAESLAQFWNAVDRTFAMADKGRENEARAQVRLSLLARQQALSTAVARLLVDNTESEEQTAGEINHVYDRVQREAYLFLAGALTTILLTGLYLIYSNRKLFAQLSLLSQQRSELAQQLISTQESTLRHLSRELHDEFGQILTAIGAMLSRLQKRSAVDPEVLSELLEVREITQSTLTKVRELSQALHPVILDEAGLATTLDWYLPTLQHRTGAIIDLETSGTSFPLDSSARIHVFRVLQEALNNVIRHSGSLCACVRLEYRPRALVVEVEDNGAGISAKSPQHGIGLVAMRERAVLLGGTIEFLRPPQGGTLVRLHVPRATVEDDEA